MDVMQVGDDSDLNDLRWHWGAAYVTSNRCPDAWPAQRRDNRDTIRAGMRGELRDRIAEDYTAKPVPR